MTCSLEKLRGPLLTLLIPVLATAVEVPHAHARTWYIKPDGTGDAPTIQAAVDAATEGDVVLVAPGTYSTTSTVNIGGTPTVVCVAIGKNVVLISEDGAANTTIGNPAANTAIYAHDVSSAANISGFRVTTSFGGYACPDASVRSFSPLPSQYTKGIRCENAQPLIADNVLTQNDTGIELIGSPASIQGNKIDESHHGIGVYSNSNPDIGGNEIHHCAVLIDIDGSAPVIHDNNLYSACAGVLSFGQSVITRNSIHDCYNTGLECSGTVNLQANRFTNTNIGIQMWFMSGFSYVAGNVLIRHAWALELSDNSNAAITIEGNTIDGSGIGIFCQAASSPVVRRNIIVDATVGIRCVLSSFPSTECNDIVASQSRYAGDCIDQTGMNGNISADPQFCGIPGSGNYLLRKDSPCAPGNHPAGYDCGVIGAFQVGCGTVAGTPITWGAVKAKYRR